MSKIIYCSDLIKELEKYIEKNGNDRVIVDFNMPKCFGNDTISRLVSVPDDDCGDNGYFCYIVLTRGDYEGRSF